VLCEDDIARRNQQALTDTALAEPASRNDQPSTSFDFTANTKRPAAMLADLAALRWLDAAYRSLL